jgi:alpha-2-macroglobulin
MSKKGCKKLIVKYLYPILNIRNTIFTTQHQFMMKPNVFFTRLSVVLLVALSFFACRRQMMAKKMTKSMASYVYAYSTGTQSKWQPVRVRFTSPLVSADQIGHSVESSIFNLTPSVSGSATWEDAQTILFKPESGFKSGQSYLANVNLKKLFKGVPKDAELFEFDFHCRSLYFDVAIDGMQPENGSDATRQELVGELITSDATGDKNLEKTLTAKQNGTALTINWTHADDGQHHAFAIKGVTRSNSDSKVDLDWSGSVIDADASGSKEVTIPAIGTFAPMGMRLVQDATQYIKVSFSDPLSTTQDLKGLLRINDWYGTLRHAVDGNNLLIYPSERISGNRSLYIDAGVQNAQGKKLAKAETYALEFADVKPQVRLIGRGVILPNSDGLNFPFEAINLNYVDVEIVKIFNNNILQFLQTNGLDGTNELERVGNIIMQKRVSLKDINPSASATKWTRYGVDLSELIKKDPSAIYQVRIGFRRNYTSYNCSNTAMKDDLQGMTLMQGDDFPSRIIDENDNDWGNQKSIFRYSWDGGENVTHNYQEEENPCSASYYNSEHFVNRNIFASDLGIIAKKGGDGSIFIAVSDLKSTSPRSGVKLDFYDYQHQIVTSVSTNGDGVAIAKDFKGKPWVVVASSGNEKGYLPLSNNNALSLSRFDVAGETMQKGMKGFLYGERGVWRPGDSLFLNFILEDKDNKLPDDYPVTLELYDPKGTLQYRTTTIQNVQNIYPFHIATREDAPTGKWRADVKAGGATFTENIKIETVKPNRLKVNLDFGKKEIAAGEENLSANMQVNWLHGGPARGSKVKIEAVVASVKTEFPKFKDYIFDNPVKSVKSDPSVLFEGSVDDNGTARVNGSIPKVEDAPGKMKVGFKIRAFEPSGDFSSDYRTLDYSPYNTYTGVSIPKNQYGEKRLDINRNGEVAVCAVDKNGTPIRNRTISAKVYRLEWRWWWETGSDDEAQFTSSKDLTPIMEQNVTTNTEGVAYIKVNVNQWGRYFVYAGDVNSGHYTGDYFYSGYPWDDDDNGSMSRNNAAMLSFSTNKDKYQTGETIELNIPTPDAGKALISIENGSKVLESKWISTHSGMTKYTFKATPEMAPTVYAFVTLVQPHNNKNNDLPMRMYGVTPINVEDPKTRLEPIVTLPDELKPEQKVTVEVRERLGKPMAYTIALVDDGLLDLTQFNTPDPWTTFYAREALGVQTFDVYDQVLGAYSGQLQRILNIGGDKAGKPKNAQSAMRFKPVVMNLGPFFVKGGSVGRHNITIPNYVGSVRAMVVAANNGAYGKVDKTMPVRKSLMVLATLPRVLSPKETLKVPVNVFAMDGKVKNATVSIVETSGLIQFNGQTSKAVTFTQPSDKMVDFDMTVNEGVGIAKFKIIAEGGGEKTWQDIEIQVRNPNPVVTDIKNAVVQAGESYNLNYQPVGVSGTNNVTLEVSTIPPIDLASRLQYLMQYPYGCVEQTTSSAFPQLYVDKIMNLDEGKKKFIASNVKAAIDRLKMFQTPTGGFGYWQGEDAPDLWATNYVGHFLLEAKQMGYALPPTMLENWIKHQQQNAKRWNPVAQSTEGGWRDESRDLTQAYRLYTLALAKNPEAGAMNILREKQNLSVAARWALASAYSLAGKPEVAKQLVNNIATTIPKYREISYTFGSELRDQAMILESLVLMGNTTQAVQVAREVSQKLSSGDWYGTQSVAYGLLSMAKFAGKTQAGSEFAFAYTINGKSGNFKSTAPIAQIDMPTNATNSLSVKNTGKNPLFISVVLRGKPAVGDTGEQPIASNLNMKIEYKTTKGEPLDPSTLRQGTDFIAEVTVANPSTLGKNYKEMALSQVFPSGWEILNSRMDKVQGWNNTTVPRYQDIRDDRVNTFFDLPQGKSHTYRVQLNAAYLGRYYLPAQQCEAMYDNSISARQTGRWVEIVGDTRKTM